MLWPSYLLMTNSALSAGNTPMFTRWLLLSLGKWSTGFSRYRSGQWSFPKEALHNCPLTDSGSNQKQKLTTKADQDPGTIYLFTKESKLGTLLLPQNLHASPFSELPANDTQFLLLHFVPWKKSLSLTNLDSIKPWPQTCKHTFYIPGWILNKQKHTC